MRDQKIPLVLVENFFDPTVTNRIRQEIPSVRSVTVPISVEGETGIASSEDLYEALVRAVEGK
jgi:hypothetical protein